ncbi:MAG: NUMOD4 domain-containing protein [Acidiphilium sp.]|nr:NUMOD4 domain-containing protein [Acidiphilium sp.]
MTDLTPENPAVRLYAQEKWLPVKGYEESYEISSHGNVRALARTVDFYREGKNIGRRLPQRNIRKGVHLGYFWVFLWKNGKKKNHRIHKMVAEHFLIKDDPTKMVAHFDGNRKNNRVENLRWATAKENAQDMARHKTSTWGEKSTHAKLKGSDIKQIRELLKHKSQTDIAKKFSISQSTVSKIKRKETWEHLT